MRNTKIIINKSNLLHNLEIIRNKALNSEIIPLIKSNAYGHGQLEIANLLKYQNIYAFGIAYTDDAYFLRSNDIKNKLLVVVPITNDDVEDVVKLDLIPSIESFNVLVELDNFAKVNNKIINFHLFINTGMNRDGVSEDELSLIVKNLDKLNNVKLEALMSHFSKSNDIDYSNLQINRFNHLIKKFNLTQIPKHISNSGGIFNLDNSQMDFVRPGISLYGINPFSDNRLNNLLPVLELKTSIKNIISIKKGEFIGYSFKYQAEKDMQIGILPIGYGDGFSYLLSNNAKCIINDEYCDIISSINMDLTICDISNINCAINDEVTLIGRSSTKEIKIIEIAERINTNPYEISTSLKSKIKRIVV